MFNQDEIKAYILTRGFPIVIKPSWLTGGKGVVIAKDMEEAMKAMDDIENNFNQKSKMEEIIEKLLEEVDADIKAILLEDSKHPKGNGKGQYKNYELLENPPYVILEWQKLRNMKVK